MKIFISCVVLAIFASPAIADSQLNVSSIADCNIKNNRIMIFEFSGYPTTQDMTDYLNDNTPSHINGRITTAYFFKKGTRMPVSGFSNCGSIMNGNMFLYESNQIDPWEFAYIHDKKGDRAVVNCRENPANKLCKQ